MNEKLGELRRDKALEKLGEIFQQKGPVFLMTMIFAMSESVAGNIVVNNTGKELEQFGEAETQMQHEAQMSILEITMDEAQHFIDFELTKGSWAFNSATVN